MIQITKVASYVPTPACHIQNYYGGLPELPLYENSENADED